MKPVTIMAVLLLLLGCRVGTDIEDKDKTAQDVVAAFFMEDLLQCQADEDCITGRCDLSPVFAISVSGGYCASFPNAFERWQFIELAQLLATRALTDPLLLAVVEDRIDKELEIVRRPAGREGMVVLLERLGTGRSRERLQRLYLEESGALRRLVALSLARLGDDRGLDELVEISLSAVVKSRLHAAYAAAGLCRGAALDVLGALLVDDHHLVRQAAAEALGRCGEAGRPLLLKRAAALETAPGVGGDRFSVKAALERHGEASP